MKFTTIIRIRKDVSVLRLAGIIFFALTLMRCSKYLEETPDMRAEIKGVDQIKSLLVSAYPAGSYLNMAESASDNVTDKGPGALGINTAVENESVYRFQDNNGRDQDYPNFYWYSAYTAIASANIALNYIDQQPDNANKEYLPYKGEALLCRAYAHFMLVTLYSKPFDEITSGGDPGVPYVTKVEESVTPAYDRGTVSSVYTNIERDLEEGIKLIQDKVYLNATKFHFNRAASEAFATRFYLFYKKYDKAVEHANNVFSDDIGNNLRPVRTDYASLSKPQQLLRYVSADEKTNLLILDNTTWYPDNYPVYRFGVTNAIIAKLYSGSNVTGGNLSLGWYYYGNNTDNIGTVKYDGHFVYSSITDGIGQRHLMWPALVAEEVLFNRAEANIALGKYDAALADLNTFATKRVENYNKSQNEITENKIAEFYGTSDLKAGLMAALLDLKRYEFVQEGMRWLDILRHRLPVKHQILDKPQGHVVETIEVGPDDPRRQFQLPEEVRLNGIDLNIR